MVNELSGLIPGIGPAAAPKVGAGGATGKGFGEFLTESLQKVNDLQRDSEAATVQIAAGGEVGIQEAMIAIEKADVAFKLMMEVRQKILDAYQEITRMQV